MTASSKGLPQSLEVAVALLLLIVAAPLLIAAAALIWLTSPGPVLFRHRRVGKDGRPFTLLKFRTMHEGGTGPEVTATADPRITPVGRVLRKTKIDELPELWNIVRGDMALVGPRPESPAYVDLADSQWQEVLRVRPGVTDPTTLRLRNEEELLAAVGGEHEAFYRNILVPYKLHGYRLYLTQRTWQSDVVVLWRTLYGVLLPWTLPPPVLEEILRPREATHE
jgi:lipopolysaccharide/colanic/teichoic acid biosynthesis glycosyltransferase